MMARNFGCMPMARLAREILGLDREVDLRTWLTGDSPFKVVGQESLTANGSQGSERHAHNL